MRLFSLCGLILWCAFAAAEESLVDLTKIDRAILKEPAYTHRPHYALFVFGQRAEHRAWFVVDGDTVAYIDRNGNGDLTDLGERVELDVETTSKNKFQVQEVFLGMHVFPLGEVFGTGLTYKLWIRNPSFVPSSDEKSGGRYLEYDKKQWVIGSLMRIAKDGSQSQNPSLLTVTPADAQISHFSGPLVFSLAFPDSHNFYPWPKRSSLEINIGCRNLPAKDCHEKSFLFTNLTTTEIPADVHPIGQLKMNGRSGEPTVQKLTCDQRCCGDRFYSVFSLPKECSGETASVTIGMPTDSPVLVRPAELTIAISQKVSRDKEQVYIMFQNPDLTMKQAVNVLRRQGMNLTASTPLLTKCFLSGC